MWLNPGRFRRGQEEKESERGLGENTNYAVFSSSVLQWKVKSKNIPPPRAHEKEARRRRMTLRILILLPTLVWSICWLEPLRTDYAGKLINWLKRSPGLTIFVGQVCPCPHAIPIKGIEHFRCQWITFTCFWFINRNSQNIIQVEKKYTFIWINSPKQHF